MKSKGPLTTEEKTQAVTSFASGKTVNSVARDLHRSPHTVKKFLGKPEVQKQVAVEKEIFALAWDDVQQRSVGSITNEKLQKSSAKDLAIIGAVATDKAAALRGEVTPTINVSALIDVAELLRNQRDRENAERVERWRAEHELPPVPGTN